MRPDVVEQPLRLAPVERLYEGVGKALADSIIPHFNLTPCAEGRATVDNKQKYPISQ